jgi:polar amino acid transport system substrate-binding protein
MKNLICFLLLFSLGLRAQAPLRVGMELSYPPFEMTDAKGEPAGVSVELAKALAQALKRPLKIVNTNFDGLIPALRTGSIDLILSSLTVNEERKRSISFSDPYVRTGLALLLAKDAKIKHAEELDQKGHKVAVKKGTTGHNWAMKSLKHAQLLVFDKENAAVLEVLQGKAHAFIYDQLSVYRHWQQHKDKSQALLEPIQKEAWAIGVKKGNEKLLSEVNAFLKDFTEKKGFEAIATKYFGQEKKVFESLGVEFLL